MGDDKVNIIHCILSIYFYTIISIFQRGILTIWVFRGNIILIMNLKIITIKSKDKVELNDIIGCMRGILTVWRVFGGNIIIIVVSQNDR